METNQVTPDQEPAMPVPVPGKRRRLVLAAVFLIIVLAGGGWFFSRKKVVAPQPVTEQVEESAIKDTLPDGYGYIPAPPGLYPRGFPTELIIYKDATVLRGEDTIDGTNTRQIIAEIFVDAALDQAKARYRAEIPELGWKEQAVQSSQDSEVLVYTKEIQILLITLIPKGNKTQAIINLSTPPTN